MKLIKSILCNILKNVNDFNILNSIITNNGKLVSSNAIYLANCKDGNIKYNNIIIIKVLLTVLVLIMLI